MAAGAVLRSLKTRTPGVFPESLVCLRCGREPEDWAHSQDTGTRIHIRLVGTKDPHLQRICGGLVVPVGEEWRRDVRSGLVWPAYATAKTANPHLVRLGSPRNARSGSWTGTPLCGKTPSGNALWIPVIQEDAPEDRLCPGCIAARDRGEAK